MKFWTVQTKSVLDTIKKEGIYLPDINKSNFVIEQPTLADLYLLITNSFNNVNNTDYYGVVFAFMKLKNNDVYQFLDYYAFLDGIYNNQDKIAALWKKFNDGEHVLLEVDMAAEFNPIIIEINNFQYLMPPTIDFLPPYMPGDRDIIIDWIKNGTFGKGYFPNSLAQAHLPYIKKDEITDVYDFPSLEEINGMYSAYKK